MTCKYCGKIIDSEKSICLYCSLRINDRSYLTNAVQKSRKQLTILTAAASAATVMICIILAALLFYRPQKPDMYPEAAMLFTEPETTAVTVTSATTATTTTRITTTYPKIVITTATTTRPDIPAYDFEIPTSYAQMQEDYPKLADAFADLSTFEICDSYGFQRNYVAFLKRLFHLEDSTPLSCIADTDAYNTLPDVEISDGDAPEITFTQHWTARDGSDCAVTVTYPAAFYLTLALKGRYYHFGEREHYYYHLYYCNEPHSRALLADIAGQITEICEGYDGDTLDLIYEAVHFVESIPYMLDSDSVGFEEYPKYPIETFTDGGGDCEDTAFMVSALLRELGFQTYLLKYPHHLAAGISGIELPDAEELLYEDTVVYFIESTGYYKTLGNIPETYQEITPYFIPLAEYPV